jgi:hypothetical protein
VAAPSSIALGFEMEMDWRAQKIIEEGGEQQWQCSFLSQFPLSHLLLIFPIHCEEDGGLGKRLLEISPKRESAHPSFCSLSCERLMKCLGKC